LPVGEPFGCSSTTHGGWSCRFGHVLLLHLHIVHHDLVWVLILVPTLLLRLSWWSSGQTYIVLEDVPVPSIASRLVVGVGVGVGGSGLLTSD
jgi:hypothetical protein